MTYAKVDLKLYDPTKTLKENAKNLKISDQLMNYYARTRNLQYKEVLTMIKKYTVRFEPMVVVDRISDGFQPDCSTDDLMDWEQSSVVL